MVSFHLFDLWVLTISWSIAFLILVSLYLYSKKKTPRVATQVNGWKPVTDFVFVWVLIFLLFFYIVTIRMSSSLLFAVGNLVVEAFLVFYIWRNRNRE